MNKWSSQSFCNKWLRTQAKLPRQRRSTLIYCTLQDPELLSVLDTIRKFEEHTNYGKVRVVVTQKPDLPDGTIEISVEDSKEMFT